LGGQEKEMNPGTQAWIKRQEARAEEDDEHARRCDLLAEHAGTASERKRFKLEARFFRSRAKIARETIEQVKSTE
jgi:hypothetical protein